MLIKAAKQISNATQYSLQGLRFLLRSELAFRLEIFLFSVLLVLFFLLGEPRSSFLYLIFIFCTLVAVSALNSAIAVILQKVSPEASEVRRNALGLGSVAVLSVFAAMFVFVAGVMITADWTRIIEIILSPLGRALSGLLLISLVIYFLIKIPYKTLLDRGVSGLKDSKFNQTLQGSWRGLGYLFKNEMAARLETYLFCILFILFLLLGEPRSSFLFLIFVFSILIAIEALNTEIEVVVDKVSPEISEVGKNAKDLGSFAVMGISLAMAVFTMGVLFTGNWGQFFENITSPLGRTFLALLFMMIAIYSLIKASFRSRLKWLVIAIVGFLFIGSIAYNLANYFTGVGIDEKVIFHLRVGFEGAGLREYSGLMALTALSAILTVIILWLTHDVLGDAKNWISKKVVNLIRWDGTASKKRGQSDSKATFTSKKAHYVNAAALLSLAMVTTPISANVIELSKDAVEQARLTDQLEFYVAPQIESLSDKKNIIVIYLEGLERTFLDEARFPGLAENLSALEKEATTFTNMIDTLGSGWTIAGLVSTQCGVPLYVSGQGNAFSGVDQFMPGANCMGDILKANGYNTTFLGGAKLEFAGKGQFLSRHGFSDVRGRKYFEKKITSPDAFSWWGLTDPHLYDELLSEIKTLAKRDKPFAIAALTLDTHFPRGFKTPQCEGVVYKGGIYKDGENTFLNSIKCSDKKTYELVQKIRNMEGLEDTIIVIASDHLSMRSSDELTALLKSGPRRNLFMILDNDPSNDGFIDREGTQFDVGATVLSKLGMSGNEFGFGRDLLAESPTLREYGEGRHNKILHQAKDMLVDRLWNYPNFTKEMQVDFEENTLDLGKRKVPLPVLFKLNDENDVLEAVFKNKASPKDLKDYLPKGYNFVWIDACAPMAERNAEFEIPKNDSAFCWSIGNKEGEIQQSNVVNSAGVLLKQDLLSSLSQN